MTGLGKVVVGVDFSEASLAAARWTAHWFAPQAELILVHALDAPRPPAFLQPLLPGVEDVLRTARDGALGRLRELADTLPSAQTRVEVREGRATERIVDVVEEAGADLVVVGEHGHRRGLRDVLGSTAEQLMHISPVPVLLARGQRDATPQRVLAPVDESEAGDRVLAWALLLRERFGARVTVLHVLNVRLLWQLRLISSETKWQELGEEMQRGAMDWLRQRVQAAGLPAEAVDMHVVFGEPSYEILAAAARHGSDLIVMASHGAGALGRVLIGSVVRSVLRGASCPVLVLTCRRD
ncbi:MAG TPA: universal stress protein [Longimicrobiales bacterium]